MYGKRAKWKRVDSFVVVLWKGLHAPWSVPRRVPRPSEVEVQRYRSTCCLARFRVAGTERKRGERQEAKKEGERTCN